MGIEKIYKCNKCGKILNSYKPHRLVQQEYAIKERNKYYNVRNIDLCNHCYEIFKKWIDKNAK